MYIDDSGKNDPPVFVLAGFIAKPDQWIAFSDRWNAALAKPPAMAYFKMVEARRKRGEFKGLSAQDRDDRLLELALIIKEHAMLGISVSIPHAAYEKVYTGKMMPWFDTPYNLAFFLVMAAAQKYLSALGNNDEIEFIFDRSLEYEKHLAKSFPTVLAGMPAEIAARFSTNPAFIDDKLAVPLQAADLLAWHIRRSWRDEEEGLRKLSVAGPVLADILGVNEVWFEHDLRYLFETGKKKIESMNTLMPYEAAAINESYDLLASYANAKAMGLADPFTTTPLASFPAIGMEKYLLVSSCAHCDISHLHKRAGNVCLAAQTAVAWGSESPTS